MRSCISIVFGLALALLAPDASAQSAQLVEAARILAPGGRTMGGPGLFSFAPNQGVNVMDLSGVADEVCASVLAITGTAEINLQDPAGAVLEGSIANATPGVGGVTAGAAACASNVGLVEVRCSANSTEDCKGVWRVDKK